MISQNITSIRVAKIACKTMTDWLFGRMQAVNMVIKKMMIDMHLSIYIFFMFFLRNATFNISISMMRVTCAVEFVTVMIMIGYIIFSI
mgnify:CR=1 FL=1